MVLKLNYHSPIWVFLIGCVNVKSRGVLSINIHFTHIYVCTHESGWRRYEEREEESAETQILSKHGKSVKSANALWKGAKKMKIRLPNNKKLTNSATIQTQNECHWHEFCCKKKNLNMLKRQKNICAPQYFRTIPKPLRIIRFFKGITPFLHLNECN